MACALNLFTEVRTAMQHEPPITFQLMLLGACLFSVVYAARTAWRSSKKKFRYNPARSHYGELHGQMWPVQLLWTALLFYFVIAYGRC
jgi:hypothetical protein